eukprot:GEMP01025434.1.p1 GENE.GEMP01025434.1~~GEMP01025434.1.p1  ORF type:complete len:596 (+),score=164.25 GEMP01025434.1:111-1898(+)
MMTSRELARTPEGRPPQIARHPIQDLVERAQRIGEAHGLHVQTTSFKNSACKEFDAAADVLETIIKTHRDKLEHVKDALGGTVLLRLERLAYKLRRGRQIIEQEVSYQAVTESSQNLQVDVAKIIHGLETASPPIDSHPPESAAAHIPPPHLATPSSPSGQVSPLNSPLRHAPPLETQRVPPSTVDATAAVAMPVLSPIIRSTDYSSSPQGKSTLPIRTAAPHWTTPGYMGKVKDGVRMDLPPLNDDRMWKLSRLACDVLENELSRLKQTAREQKMALRRQVNHLQKEAARLQMEQQRNLFQDLLRRDRPLVPLHHDPAHGPGVPLIGESVLLALDEEVPFNPFVADKDVLGRNLCPMEEFPRGPVYHYDLRNNYHNDFASPFPRHPAAFSADPHVPTSRADPYASSPRSEPNTGTARSSAPSSSRPGAPPTSKATTIYPSSSAEPQSTPNVENTSGLQTVSETPVEYTDNTGGMQTLDETSHEYTADEYTDTGGMHTAVEHTPRDYTTEDDEYEQDPGQGPGFTSSDAHGTYTSGEEYQHMPGAETESVAVTESALEYTATTEQGGLDDFSPFHTVKTACFADDASPSALERRR